MCSIEIKLDLIEAQYCSDVPSELYFTFPAGILEGDQRTLIINMFYEGIDPGQEHYLVARSNKFDGFMLRISKAKKLHVCILFACGFVGELYQVGDADPKAILRDEPQPHVIDFTKECLLCP